MSEERGAEIRTKDIRAIVVETLAEQHRLRHSDLDAVVLKTIATILTTFGIEEEDRRELRGFPAFAALAQERRAGAKLYLKAVITVIVTGFAGRSGSAPRSCSANEVGWIGERKFHRSANVPDSRGRWR